MVEVAGWGVHDIDYSERSKILQTVRLPVVTIEKCAKIRENTGNTYDDGIICVGGVKGKGKKKNFCDVMLW
jgi:Trypsin